MTAVPETVPPTTAASARSVAVREPRRGDFTPMQMSEALKFAETVQRAEGMIPKAYLGNPGKILACVLAGQELGVGPMASMRAFHVVEGKPCADYSFWVARLKAAGYKLEWLVREQERVSLRLTSPEGATHIETWDKARAVTAGLWNGKDTWKKYPQTMLSARCVTSAGRAFAAEVMFGCYENDEADEIVRDVEATNVSTSQTTGPVTQRVIAATGSQVDADAAATEQKAKECIDMLKALGLGRADVLALFKELGIEHTEKTRIADLTRSDLEKLAERIDAELKLRQSGSEASEPTGGDG